jgi:hypothetical protein
MAFSLSPNESQENIVDAVNYLLSNFKGTVSANNSNGQVTGPSNTVISYLYKYLAIKYADSFDGQVNFSNSPTNRLYYGIRNTDSSIESTSYQDYVWTQVTGGFGTTKFFFYSVTGGRTIVVQIATSLPSANYLQETGSSIDLDISTVIPSGAVTSVTATAPVFSSGGVTPVISMPVATTSVNGYLSSIDWNTFNNKASVGTAPVTKTANFTVGLTDSWLINNKSGSTCTVTMPAAASYSGRQITFKNMQAQLLVSASSNIVPLDSTTAGTAILLNVIGNWATVVSDGSNWVIMQAAANNNLLLE